VAVSDRSGAVGRWAAAADEDKQSGVQMLSTVFAVVSITSAHSQRNIPLLISQESGDCFVFFQ